LEGELTGTNMQLFNHNDINDIIGIPKGFIISIFLIKKIEISNIYMVPSIKIVSLRPSRELSNVPTILMSLSALTDLPQTQGLKPPSKLLESLLHQKINDYESQQLRTQLLEMQASALRSTLQQKLCELRKNAADPNLKRKPSNDWEENPQKKMKVTVKEFAITGRSFVQSHAFAISPLSEKDGIICPTYATGKIAILDFLNIFYRGGKNLGKPISVESTKNAIDAFQDLFMFGNVKEYFIVMTDLIGKNVCDAIGLALFLEALKYGKSVVVYSYTGSLRNGDDLLCIYLSHKYLCTVISNDRMNKDEDIIEDGQIVEHRIVFSSHLAVKIN